MIQCPRCGNTATEVNNTRPRQAVYIWRSRTCKSCGKTFSTREYALHDLDALINNDGQGQDLSSDQVEEILEDLTNAKGN